MDSDEWARWRAYRLMYPIGDDLTQILLAQVLTYLHNLWTDTEKHGAKNVVDFLPHLGTRTATLSEVKEGSIRIAPHLKARLDGAE